MRVAIYARFSTDKQKEASIEDQIRSCERTAAQLGLVVSHRFEDRGISGGTVERPGYQRLLAAARAGQIDGILAEDISRLWRNRAEYGQRSAELEDLGVHLLTCVGDDTRRDGWGLTLTIKQAMAESARREISYRTRRGLEGRALAGKPTGGRCYGTRPEECGVVGFIYRSRAMGVGLAEIARRLNAAGRASPRGGAWGRSTVAYILANVRYLGQVEWGRTELKGGARDSRHKRRVERPDGPLVARYDESRQLVPVELWQAAQEA